MPAYTYAGQLRSNNAISGTIEADTAEAAMIELQTAGIRVTSVSPAAAMSPARPLSRDDFLYFNQQLASLAESGIALDKGLRIVAKDLRRGRLRKAVEDIAADLERGTPMEEAVNRRAGLFPPLYGEILKSGVENHRLGTTLCNLSTHLLVMQDSRRLFWQSATYPIIVGVVGFVVLSIFMLFVVPEQEQFVQGFLNLEMWNYAANSDEFFTLPTLTRYLFIASHHWSGFIYAVVGGIAAIIALLGLLKLFPGGRHARQILFSFVPGVYGVYKASLLARFSQAAALSASAGHDLPRVLRLAAGATGHQDLMSEADRLGKQIEAGSPPSPTEEGTGLIPALFSYTARIAGRRGQLAAALTEMARSYEAIAKHRLMMLRMILTPLLLIVTGVVLALGIAAMFSPLSTLVDMLCGMAAW